MTHYYTDNTNLAQNRKEITFRFSGITFSFITDNGVFSKTEVDFGTWVLLDTLKHLDIKGKVLDLGCGYGVVGIVINRLFTDTELLSVDVNPRAVELAKLNYAKNAAEGTCLISNIYEKVEGKFANIITNPPIRAGKAVIYQMFEQAWDHLEDQGCLWVVIRKAQGAKSAQAKIAEVFGNCEVIRKEKGYFILKAKKVDNLTLL
ncbi:MAG: class I SAM-dependent methyltransferase [Erysipelotrichaceae bacterium]|nr:class I SAM-dependent methyltransferase [Erysipelotrichaceae bacterium]